MNTSIARGVIVTVWSKRSTTAGGGLSSRDWVAGVTDVSVACADAPAGKRQRDDDNGEGGVSPRPAGELREVPEDRCDVAVAEQHHGDHDPRHREPGRPGAPTRLQRLAEREDRRHEQRPADRVVEEGRAEKNHGFCS